MYIITNFKEKNNYLNKNIKYFIEKLNTSSNPYEEIDSIEDLHIFLEFNKPKNLIEFRKNDFQDLLNYIMDNQEIILKQFEQEILEHLYLDTNINYNIEIETNIKNFLNFVFNEDNKIIINGKKENHNLQQIKDFFKEQIKLMYEPTFKQKIELTKKEKIKLNSINKNFEYFTNLDLSNITNISKLNYLLYTKLKNFKKSLDLRHYKNTFIKEKIKEIKQKIDLQKIEKQIKERKKELKQVASKKHNITNIFKLDLQDLQILKNTEVNFNLQQHKQLKDLKIGISLQKFDKKISNQTLIFDLQKFTKLIKSLKLPLKINIKSYKKFSNKIEKIEKIIKRYDLLEKTFQKEIELINKYIETSKSFTSNLENIEQVINELENKSNINNILDNQEYLEL